MNLAWHAVTMLILYGGTALMFGAAAEPAQPPIVPPRTEPATKLKLEDASNIVFFYIEKPKPAVVKTFFVRTENEQLVHRSAMLRLTCGFGKGLVVALVPEVAPSEPKVETAPLSARGWGRTFDFVMKASGNAASLATNFDVALTLAMSGFSAAYARLLKACGVS